MDLTVLTDRLVQRPGRHLLHRVLVEDEAALLLAAEEHVLDDVEVVAEREVLVDDLDAQGAGVARAVDLDGLAVEQVVAGVDRVDPADALDEGGLAGAVVSDQRGHLSEMDGEVDVVQDLYGTEALVDPTKFQYGGH